jgi:hypothetical protein
VPSPSRPRFPAWLVAVLAVLAASGSGLVSTQTSGRSSSSARAVLDLGALGRPGETATIASRSERETGPLVAKRSSPTVPAHPTGLDRTRPAGSAAMAAIERLGQPEETIPNHRRGPPGLLA